MHTGNLSLPNDGEFEDFVEELNNDMFFGQGPPPVRSHMGDGTSTATLKRSFASPSRVGSVEYGGFGAHVSVQLRLTSVQYGQTQPAICRSRPIYDIGRYWPHTPRRCVRRVNLVF